VSDIPRFYCQPAEAFFDYIGEISLIKDFSSTMDVVLTEEEKAEMEAAEKEADAEATGTKEDVAKATAAAAATEAPTGATATETEPQSSLAHHSSFSKPGASTNAAASGSTDHIAKKAEGGAVGDADKGKKAKAKLTPEQRAKLAELEAKRDEEKEKRYVYMIVGNLTCAGSRRCKKSSSSVFGPLSMPNTQEMPTTKRPKCLRAEFVSKQRT
jgi:hypothetical protein